jgi:hypothetical protein
MGADRAGYRDVKNLRAHDWSAMARGVSLALSALQLRYCLDHATRSVEKTPASGEPSQYLHDAKPSGLKALPTACPQ